MLRHDHRHDARAERGEEQRIAGGAQRLRRAGHVDESEAVEEVARGDEVGERVGKEVVGEGEGEVEEVGDGGGGGDEENVEFRISNEEFRKFLHASFAIRTSQFFSHRSSLSNSSGLLDRTRASSTVIIPCRTSRTSESSMVIIPCRLPRVISVVRFCSLSLRM